MRYAQHLFVNIAILEKIVQHPELRKGLCTYPTLVCEESSLAKVAIGESHSYFETFCFKGGGGGRYHFCKKFFF